MPDLDLFGQLILTSAPVADCVPKRRKTVPQGYAATPGTGPAGETCKTCAFYSGHKRSKVYRKCALMRQQWTGGPGTDILAKSPACAMWSKESVDCPDCKGSGRITLPTKTGKKSPFEPTPFKWCAKCRGAGQLPTP